MDRDQLVHRVNVVGLHWTSTALVSAAYLALGAWLLRDDERPRNCRIGADSRQRLAGDGEAAPMNATGSPLFIAGVPIT